MGRLSAALLAKLDKAVDLWEIDLPDGTTWRLGPVQDPQGSASQGWYEPRVRDFMEWSEQLGDTTNAVVIQQYTIAINDIAGAAHSLRDMLGRGDQVQNVPVRRYLAAPDVDFADWCPMYVGTLDDWALDSATTAKLMVRPDDSAMTGAVLKRKASQYDWAALPDASEGLMLPLVVGKHSDEGRNTLGALEAFQVDPTGYRYYVGLGIVNVLRVYRAAAIKTPTTDYTIDNVLINDMRHTLINMVANPGTDTIRFDCEGHYTVGTGSGAPIMGAVAAMRHVLSQVIFGEWKTGAWLAESARIHAASWTAVETALANRADGAAYVSAFYVNDSDTTGYAFLNQWLKANHLYAYWRGDGTLALFFWEPNATPSADATLVESQCNAGGFKLKTPKDRMLMAIIGQWGLATAGARYEQEVRNPEAATSATETIDCTSGPNTWP